MQHISLALLLVATLKVGVWVAVFAVAAHQRRVLPMIYAPLGAIATLVRGLSDAHLNIPAWMSQAAVFVGTPIAFLILASLLVTAPTLSARGSRWSL